MAFGFSIPNIVKRILPWKNSYFFETWNGETDYGNAKRLKSVLENPAALFIFTLLTDLASMGEYKLYKKGAEDPGDELEEHAVLDLLKNPNPMQTEEQFKWDFMFWRMTGSANMLSDSKILKRGAKNVLYWLSPDCIDWPKWFLENEQTLFISDESIRELGEKQIIYKTANQKLPFKYKHLKQFFDISNGVKGWFNPPSRVDALYKIVSNSDNILDSKNVNSHLARKFIISGKHDVRNTSTLPMGKGEKDDIERKVFSKKSVHGMKSMIDIKRFLDDLGALEKLDKAFMNDAFFIGKMYKIPKDVIESFEQGSTYENQEKARAAVISYCVQPSMEDFCKGFLDFFGIDDLVLKVDYSHLPFVQTFEKDKAETLDKKAAAFKKLVEAGADQQQAAEICGIDIDIFGEPRNLSGNQNAQEDKTLIAV